MGFRDTERVTNDRHAEISREAHEALLEIDADLISHGYTVNEATYYYTVLSSIASEMAFDIRRDTHPYRRVAS